MTMQDIAERIAEIGRDIKEITQPSFVVGRPDLTLTEAAAMLAPLSANVSIDMKYWAKGYGDAHTEWRVSLDCGSISGQSASLSEAVNACIATHRAKNVAPEDATTLETALAEPVPF